MSELLTPNEAARIVRLSPNTLAKWRHYGTGPKFVKVGTRRVLYLKCELDAWLAERGRQSTSEAAA